MNSYFKKQIDEIADTPGLKLYGAFLALTHLWTFFYWNRNDAFARILSGQNQFNICFPFFPNCKTAHIFSADTVRLFLYAYLLLAIGNFILFLVPKQTGKAYGLFVFLFFYKCFFYFQYYGFMGNYHYMANIISFTYLFLPHKKTVAKLMIVGFYMSAGSLKLSLEWLSGAAMIKVPFLLGSPLVASLFYVVFLELVIVLALLSSSVRWRWFALVQFLAFHIFSWHIVGFFYPCIMASILAIFFIDEYLAKKKLIIIPSLYEDLTNFKLHNSTYVACGILIFMQVIPFFFTSDPAISGALRLTSLNMFDANTRCHPLILAKTKDSTVQLQMPQARLGVRIHCDPIVFYSQLSELCEANKKDPQIEKLTFSLVSKRLTDIDYKPVLFLKDACNIKGLYWSEFFRFGVFQ